MDADPDPVEVQGFDQRQPSLTSVDPVVPTSVDPAASATLDHLVRVATATLHGEGVERGRLDLVLVDRDEMADLNQAHMGKAGPTDVLSFPLDGADALSVPEVHLGDIVLCPAVASAQAAEHCGTVDAELTLLVIHGVLHILGHDHAEPEETNRMVSRERHHLASYGITHPGPVGVGDTV